MKLLQNYFEEAYMNSFEGTQPKIGQLFDTYFRKGKNLKFITDKREELLQEELKRVEAEMPSQEHSIGSASEEEDENEK